MKKKEVSVMDAKTLKQTIIAGVVSVFVSLRVLGVFVFANHTLDMIFAVLIVAAMYFAWGYFSHWKNNDFTAGSKLTTRIMRKVKKLLKEGDAEVYDKLEHALDKLEKEV